MNSSVFFFDVSEIDHRRGYCIVSEPFCCRFVVRKQPIDVFRAKKCGKQLRITKENPSRDDQQSSNHNKNPGIYHLTSWHWIFFWGKSLHFFCPKAFPSRLVESLSTFLEKIGRNAWGIPLFLLNPNKLKGSNRCLFINFSWSWVTAPPYWWKAYGCRWGNPVEAEDS